MLTSSYLCVFQAELAPQKLNKSKSHCCVPLCTVTGYVIEDGKKVTFHQWPLKDETLMKQWIQKCRRDIGKHFQVTRHTKICSRHFEESDFLTKPTAGKRMLKKGAVPSKFEWSINKPRRESRKVLSSASAPLLKKTRVKKKRLEFSIERFKDSDKTFPFTQVSQHTAHLPMCISCWMLEKRERTSSGPIKKEAQRDQVGVNSPQSTSFSSS